MAIGKETHTQAPSHANTNTGTHLAHPIIVIVIVTISKLTVSFTAITLISLAHLSSSVSIFSYSSNQC
jgi:hypothetical protein